VCGGSERKEGRVDEQLSVDASASTRVPGAKNPPAEVASARETVAGDAMLVPCRSGVVDHGAMCGMLMEQLEDVSCCSVCAARFRWLVITFLTFVFS
jgi:hypothetical protein